MSEQTTQETAAEVIAGSRPCGRNHDEAARLALEALAAAGWSVVRLEQVGKQDYEGWYVGTVTSGQPAYVVTAGEVSTVGLQPEG